MNVFLYCLAIYIVGIVPLAIVVGRWLRHMTPSEDER